MYLYSRLEVLFKVIPVFGVLEDLYYSIRKGSGVVRYGDIPFATLDLRAAADSKDKDFRLAATTKTLQTSETLTYARVGLASFVLQQQRKASA